MCRACYDLADRFFQPRRAPSNAYRRPSGRPSGCIVEHSDKVLCAPAYAPRRPGVPLAGQINRRRLPVHNMCIRIEAQSLDFICLYLVVYPSLTLTPSHSGAVSDPVRKGLGGSVGSLKTEQYSSA